MKAFPRSLTRDECEREYDLRVGVDLRLLFDRCTSMTGIDFGEFDDFMTGIFMCPTLHAIVDDLPVVRFFQAFATYKEVNDKVDKKRLIDKVIHKRFLLCL